MSPDNNCRTCKWWDEDGDWGWEERAEGERWGLCTVHEVAGKGVQVTTAMFTRSDFGCTEWEPREASE